MENQTSLTYCANVDMKASRGKLMQDSMVVPCTTDSVLLKAPISPLLTVLPGINEVIITCSIPLGAVITLRKMTRGPSGDFFFSPVGRVGQWKLRLRVLFEHCGHRKQAPDEILEWHPEIQPYLLMVEFYSVYTVLIVG